MQTLIISLAVDLLVFKVYIQQSSSKSSMVGINQIQMVHLDGPKMFKRLVIENQLAMHRITFPLRLESLNHVRYQN